MSPQIDSDVWVAVVVAGETLRRARELNQIHTEEPKTIPSTYNSALEDISMDLNEEPQQCVNLAQELMATPITDNETLEDLSTASDDDGYYVGTVLTYHTSARSLRQTLEVASPSQ